MLKTVLIWLWGFIGWLLVLYLDRKLRKIYTHLHKTLEEFVKTKKELCELKGEPMPKEIILNIQ